jgi:ABC-type branched-subunit amino acid transport system ATPase component
MVGLQKNSIFEMALKESSLIASEALQNIKTLRAFTARKWTITRYSDCVETPLSTASKEAIYSGLLYGASNSTIFFSYALGFWYGGTLVVNENLPMQTMIQSLMGIVLAATGAGQAMAFLPELVTAKAAAYEVFSLIDNVSATKKGSHQLISPSSVTCIEFKNLKFAYPTRPEIDVLKGVSFSVKSGEKVALVGPSGSGKSSIMALLERFYEPSSGQILIDNVPLASFNVSEWRSQIGYVGQEPVLFDLTLEENLRYGFESASRSDLEAVATRANMDFVGSVKWEDRLGPKGSLLSGGQKQRTAIARALLRDAPLLLLDEATSALDSASEAQVQAALDSAQTGRTTITIAHRLSTIKDYDKIYVIASGIVVESGTHEELMKLGKVYHDLYLKGQQKSN